MIVFPWEVHEGFMVWEGQLRDIPLELVPFFRPLTLVEGTGILTLIKCTGDTRVVAKGRIVEVLRKEVGEVKWTHLSQALSRADRITLTLLEGADLPEEALALIL
jgi:hypothetical protein